MFKLINENPIVTWPVTIAIPADQGKVLKAKCKLTFELIDDDEFSELAAMGDDVLLQRVVSGWQDVGDEDGKPLPFSEENLRRFSKRAYVRRSIFAAYQKANTGTAEKN